MGQLFLSFLMWHKQASCRNQKWVARIIKMLTSSKVYFFEKVYKKCCWYARCMVVGVHGWVMATKAEQKNTVSTSISTQKEYTNLSSLIRDIFFTLPGIILISYKSKHVSLLLRSVFALNRFVTRNNEFLHIDWVFTLDIFPVMWSQYTCGLILDNWKIKEIVRFQCNFHQASPLSFFSLLVDIK